MKYSHAVFGAFMMNGLGGLLIQYLAKQHPSYGVPSLAISCFTAFIFTLVLGEKVNESRASLPASTVVGLLAGLGWAGGLVWQVQAISLVPGYILFPCIAGSCTLLVSVVSRFVFGEKIGVNGILGIGFCVLAVVLLSV
ncbi:MAG: hypothetical protein ACYC1M_14140 [Armatimonadota bacterium]